MAIDNDALDWDMTEVDDQASSFLLEPGDYFFEVKRLEKERFDGSANMGPCPRAKLTLAVSTHEGGTCTVTDRINLHAKTAWVIGSFFKCLGFEPDPATGKVPVQWGQVEGRCGWVRIKTREYEYNGEARKANDVERYLTPEEGAKCALRLAESMAPSPAQQAAYQQAYAAPGAQPAPWSM